MTTAILAPSSAAAVVVDLPVTNSVDDSSNNHAEVGASATLDNSICKQQQPVCEDAAEDHARTQNDPHTGAATRRAASVRLKRCNSTPAAQKSQRLAKKHKKRRRVSFESAEIFEFEPTIFTTSVTSGGIPVGMSLQERSRSRRRLDSWEMEREDLRVGRQNYMEEGYLDPVERETILNNAGCAEHSMLSVEAEVNQIIAHRRESNETDFEFLYGLAAIGEDEEEEEEEDDDDDEEEEEEEEVEEVLLMSVGSVVDNATG